MKTRKTQIKWVTERCSNTRKMRRYTLTLKRKIQAGLMMVPPHCLSPWQRYHPTTQDSRGTARWQHTTQTHQTQVSLFFFWRGSASEDQTYRRPPVTHHHYISAQYHHIPEVTLSRRDERRKTGKEGTRRDVTLCDVVTTWENVAPCTVPSVGLDNAPTGREATMAVTRISTVCVMVDRMIGALCVYVTTVRVWFQNRWNLKQACS